MIFLDIESCGYHGPTVLIQWAEDDGPIQLYNVWKEPVQKTLELIEYICTQPVCGFNLAFDWFHLCQTYTTLSLLPKGEPPEILQYALSEEKARDGLCLKPESACDIMLVARKGEYQSTMDRNDIRIKRVPTPLAYELAEELNKRIPLKDVYFARYSDPKRRWQVRDIEDDFGDIIPEFKDLTLTFMPSSALKALAQDALGIEDAVLFGEIGLPKSARPNELGYAPFATALGNPDDWNGTWPMVIDRHISYWSYNRIGREYAEKDVVYTRDLYKYFGSPKPGDTDSVLACMVGAVRWRGYDIDIDGIKELRNNAQQKVDKVKMKFNFESPKVCRIYMEEVLNETEKLAMKQGDSITTKATVLEQIAKWTNQEVCARCEGMGCADCNNEGLIDGDEKHPAAIRAREILDARHAKKEVELYNKLLVAGRFHASFKVTGTLSNRMSGGDGLNPQGIKRDGEVRVKFPLAFPPLNVLCGGDFGGYEVSIADAVYGDPKLHEQLLSGKKIHALFGVKLFPNYTYDEICATKNEGELEKNLYTRAKNCVFAMLYGGEAYTLMKRGNIPEEIANKAYNEWLQDYKVWDAERKKYSDMFCSMKQPGGIGTRVEWHEPADYIESMFGFRRYFTLENRICKALYELAEKPPKHWDEIKLRVTRRDREQTALGALRTALFAAAFALQASNMRAAGNHVIQSPGATMTKELQRRLWELQPSGVYQWRIQPMNIHDEILAPMISAITDKATKIVDEFIEEYREWIPLLEMEWKTGVQTWADK